MSTNDASMPGQDVVDDALVDVAGDRAAARALDVDLATLAVLDDGDARLADLDRDEDLLLDAGERGARAAGRPARRAGGRRGACGFGSAFAAAAPVLLLGARPRGLRGDGLRRRGCPGFFRPRPPRFPRGAVRGSSVRSAPGAGASSSACRRRRGGLAGRLLRSARLPAEPLQHGCLLSGARCGRCPDQGAGRGRVCLKIHWCPIVDVGFPLARSGLGAP